jgi:hypothetical protein
MKYEIEMLYDYDEAIQVEVADNLECRSIFTPAGGRLHEPDFGTPDCSGHYKGQSVKVDINLHLDNFYLEARVHGLPFVEVKETNDSKLLKKHLLRELKQQWLRDKESEGLGADAKVILKRADAEIRQLAS